MAAIRGSHSWVSSSVCGVGLVSGWVTATVFWGYMDLSRLLARDVASLGKSVRVSCAYQTFRVHRHFDLRVLPTTARVPRISSGRSVLELSLDHGRASQVEPHVRDKVSLQCSGPALADMPMCTTRVSSLTLVLDERVGEKDLNCSDARFWSPSRLCMGSLCEQSAVKSRLGVAEESRRLHLFPKRNVTGTVSSGTSARRIALPDRFPPQSCQRD